ncbi:hypothetical protein F8A86_02440 [Betaproteobacteria bacterium SCN1]|jgi:hypothetical protein|nr:hypothetical protein F8A86_02440 [Betaproteobacteria bacterium SCN1]MBN8760669.1 hypothetical protein [Thiobacillus sp.]ODU88003.1 MAG: hypothetical protein ABT21_11415 [Thiobacillus sp. SCN 65-179]OJW36251.1 MAG: hypothetical protein BGO61_00770 [Thiobacillus sp. 65-69]
MNALTFDTPAEGRAAFDTLLAGAHRLIRLYDREPLPWALDDTDRHAVLRAFCAAGGGRRIECLFDDTRHLTRDCPRLMRLLRDFGHVLEIRQTEADTPLPDEAFALADRHGILLRADKAALHGIMHPDDPGRATRLHQTFEALWQRAAVRISATPLGL